MAKLIKCSCGKIVRGENDEELLANADEHIRTDHPDMVGKISHEDLLAMADLRQPVDGVADVLGTRNSSGCWDYGGILERQLLIQHGLHPDFLLHH